MHYLGDHNDYQPEPHGNSKSRNRGYIRTCPSVIAEIKKSVNIRPAATYHKMVNDVGHGHIAHEAVNKPKNRKQVENAVQTQKNKNKISHDAIYNANWIAHELHDFIYEIRTFPELVFFMAHPDIISDFNKLLMMKSNEQLYCVYDTTFQLGDFYITVVCFRHILFENNPFIPLAFLLHGKKLQFNHEDFITSLSRRIPNLKKSNIPIIVDREKGITNAFEAVLPNINVLHCWNHLKSDLKRWLLQNGARSAEVPIYKLGLEKILQSDSSESFEQNCQSVLGTWSQPAVAYLNKYVKNDILKYSVKFVLQENNVYNPYSGVTNNAAESFNAVIKRLMDWKESPADTIALCFYYLQNYYLREIYRGFCNLGTYQLLSKYSDLLQNPEDLNFPTETCSPGDIVDRVKESIHTFAREPASPEVAALHNADIDTDPEQDPVDTAADTEKNYLHPDLQQETPTKRQFETPTKSKFIQNNMSQIALAQRVINEKKIELVPKKVHF